MHSSPRAGWLLSGLLLLLLAATASAQAPASATTPATAASAAAVQRARDLNEEVHLLPVTVRDLTGRRETVEIPLTIYRPSGAGPFPLLVMSHGRGSPEQRRQQGRVRYDTLARYFVDKGFAVLVPTRVGYGPTFGDFDPENAGGCLAMRVEEMSLAASDQVLAAVDYARRQPWADATRWIAAGQSVGGMATMAVAWRNPPGLLATINFSGGAGGAPDQRPGDPCTPQNLERLWRSKAGLARTPSLWFYWENDRYWGAELPRRWARAWQDGGGELSFHLLPAIGREGHAGLSRDMDHWVPLAEAWLAGLGFTTPGDVPLPPPTSFAAVDEVDKVPISPASRERLYRRFLAAPLPRAFAIGRSGGMAWATGDWARGRALGDCRNVRNEPCTLYAVDDKVVWAGDETTAR